MVFIYQQTAPAARCPQTNASCINSTGVSCTSNRQRVVVVVLVGVTQRSTADRSETRLLLHHHVVFCGTLFAFLVTDVMLTALLSLLFCVGLLLFILLHTIHRVRPRSRFTGCVNHRHPESNHGPGTWMLRWTNEARGRQHCWTRLCWSVSAVTGLKALVSV